jgi:hypothetical protein
MSRFSTRSRYWAAPDGVVSVVGAVDGLHVRWGTLWTALGRPPRSVTTSWRRRGFPKAVNHSGTWLLPAGEAVAWLHDNTGIEINVEPFTKSA